MTAVGTSGERIAPARIRPSLDDLRRKSVEARKLIVQAIHHAGAGHLGGPLSATDLLIALYFDQMDVDPGRPDWPRAGPLHPQQGALLDRPLHRPGHARLLPD